MVATKGSLLCHISVNGRWVEIIDLGALLADALSYVLFLLLCTPLGPIPAEIGYVIEDRCQDIVPLCNCN